MLRRIASFFIAGLMAGSSLFADDKPASAVITPEQNEFFEKKIRPVLVSQCLKCHSAEAREANQLKGSLLLDSREGWSTGGDSGPAIEPGKPDDSLLIEALRYDTLKMPPQGKLPGNVIADFEAWVKMGAPDPRTGSKAGKPKGIDLETGRKHWSYQPITLPAIPAVKSLDWSVNPIDRFVLAGLEPEGLRPVEISSREVLVRRLYFDLIGLPPTPEQINAFVNDTRPEAWTLLVDQLLASPHFGERWGRHWLDVVRYADSLTLRGFIFPEAWRYRDYVIENFNADRPYDRFLREQVAGDLLPADSLAEKQRQCVATTFLVLGNTNLEEQDKVQLRMDVVDEQLDVISKGFLAQTVTCARCHDHKFDPIPTRDYYALAGILRNAKTLEHANVSKWLEMPLPVEPAQEALFKEQEARVAQVQERINALKKVIASADSNKDPALKNAIVAAKDLPGVVVDSAQAKQVGEWKLSQFSMHFIGDGYLHDLDRDKGAKTLTFQPELATSGTYEVRLAYTPGDNRSDAVPVTVFSADGEKTIEVNEQLPPPIEGRFISLGQYRFEQTGQGFVIIANSGTKGHVIADAVQFLPASATDAVTPTPVPATDKSAASPTAAPDTKIKQQTLAELKELEQDLKRLTTTGPQRPRFMSVQEEKEQTDCAIHIRGSVHNLGPQVARGFLSVASHGSAPVLPQGSSGRLQLGDWLADPANPLPARVMANRVWHWLLGSGLVRTNDNFGTTGELPSHPQLLDYLAHEFIADQWSVKALVRKIVLSRTYQLSSVASPELLKADPENRLLGRANRRRQDAECLLDAMLTASETLDHQPGGSTIAPGTQSDFGYQFRLTRRAVYWPVMRNSLPELFEAFDFPDPSMVFGRRNNSTVASQALFLMNSPFVRDQAHEIALALEKKQPIDEAARLRLVFRALLGRNPSKQEQGSALAYLHSESKLTDSEKRQRWIQVVQAILGTVDFRYVE